jgi:hypothetical protein
MKTAYNFSYPSLRSRMCRMVFGMSFCQVMIAIVDSLVCSFLRYAQYKPL